MHHIRPKPGAGHACMLSASVLCRREKRWFKTQKELCSALLTFYSLIKRMGAAWTERRALCSMWRSEWKQKMHIIKKETIMFLQRRPRKNGKPREDKLKTWSKRWRFCGEGWALHESPARMSLQSEAEIKEQYLHIHLQLSTDFTFSCELETGQKRKQTKRKNSCL